MNEQSETEPELEPPQLFTGHIYMLLHSNYIYIGSTINFKNRYSEHKLDYRKKIVIYINQLEKKEELTFLNL